MLLPHTPVSRTDTYCVSFFVGKTVSFEDSSAGLAQRLGVTRDDMEQVTRNNMKQVGGLRKGSKVWRTVSMDEKEPS